MRKNILLIFVVLLCAGPALAGVTVEATVADGNEVTISYQMDVGDSNLPSVFALDISISQENGAQIGPVTVLSNAYWIYLYPGSIDINETTGLVDSNGTPVAENDGNSITIEMGSLYQMGVDPAPASSGSLLSFRVSADCTVSLAENAARGGVGSNGVVMEDTTKSFAKPYVTLIGAEVSGGCMCKGDITDSTAIGPPDGQVDLGDFNAFLFLLGPHAGADPAYTINPTPSGYECADLTDSGGTGPPDGKLDLGDFNAFLFHLGSYAVNDYNAPCIP